MAITITPRATAANGATAAQTLASGSFTPSANSKLYVVAHAQRNVSGTLDFTISTTITGITAAFARLAFPTPANWNTDPSFHGTIAIWEATVGGSPGAGTITVDWATSTGTAYGCFLVFDATGSTAVPSIRSPGAVDQLVANATSKGGGNTETHTTGTLGSAVTTGNTAIVCFGASIDSNGAAATPSGWTALASPAAPQTAQVSTMAVFKKTDFTGTSVTCTDLGQQVGTGTAVLFELEEAAAGGGSVTGTGAASLSGLIATGVGTRKILGAIAQSLSGLTATAAGDREVFGSVAQALSGLTATATGTVTPVELGTAAATLSGLTATVSAVRTVNGTVTQSFGGLTATATSLRTVNGAIAQSFGGLTATATATRTTAGSGTAALSGLTAAATGTRSTTGTAAANFGGLTATATDGNAGAVNGTADATLSGLTATATGTRKVVASGAATLSGLTATSTGTPTVNGAATVAFGGLTASGTATRTVIASSTTDLGGITGTVLGVRTVTGIGSSSFDGLTATVVLVSGAPVLTGRLTVTRMDAPRTTHRVDVVRNTRRVDEERYTEKAR